MRRKIRIGTRIYLHTPNEKADTMDRGIKSPYECISITEKYFIFAKIIRGNRCDNVRACLREYDLKDRFAGLIRE